MSQEDARNRLLGALPHLRIAIEMAKLQVPDGTVGLAIVATAPDGTGKLTAKFDTDDFLSDIAEVLGVKDNPGWMEDVEVATDEEPEGETQP